MKKTFFSRTRTALAAAAMGTVGVGAASADTVAINFMGTGYGALGAAVTADAYGVAVADWTNQDAGNSDGSTMVTGILFDWAIANDWNQNIDATAGEGEVNYGYLDDTINAMTHPSGGTLDITGLAAWLAGTGDSSYTIQVIQSSDNATAFTDVVLFNGMTNLESLTNSAVGAGGTLGGATSVSGLYSFDQIFLDPNDRNGSIRGTISGVIITSSSAIPEPGSAVFLGVAGCVLAFSRRRKS
jgi:hypothetical protein